MVITDEIPISLTNTSFQPSAITITPTGSLSYVWQVEDLSPGEAGLITISAQVNSSFITHHSSFTNTATIATTSVDGDSRNNSTSAGMEVVAPDLSITKAVIPTSVAPGDTITYTLTITNSGTAPARATITDTFSPALDVLNCTETFTLTDIYVSPNLGPQTFDGNGTLVMSQSTSGLIPAGSLLNEYEFYVAGDTLNGSWPSEIGLALYIPSGQVGSYDFGTDLGYPDDEGSYNETFNGSGSGSAEGSYEFHWSEDYNDTGDDNQINTATFTITYSVLVTTPLGAGDLRRTVTITNGTTMIYECVAKVLASAGSSITNTATVFNGLNTVQTSNQVSTAITHPDLTLSKAVDPATAAPGDTITYTLTFSNMGNDTASGVVITDFIPAEITVLNIISSGDMAITRTTIQTEVLTFAIANATSAVSPGQVGLITITAQISSSFIIHRSSFTNTATIAISNGPTTEIITTNNTAEAGLAISNVAPVLAAIDPWQTITETETLTFTASATDTNADTLSYSLYNAPATATINSSTGLFTWATTEADGPAVYSPTMIVSDGSLTDSQTILITVTEVNSPPLLAPIGDKTGAELTVITFMAIGDDSTDIPANTPLSFGLLNAPSGATIISHSGVFSWTPSESQGPGLYTVTVLVSDTGSPILTATETIRITVNDQTITGLSATSDSPTTLGNSTNFTVTITAGSNVSYNWNFGDGNIGSGNTISHTYAAVNIYTVLITASNGTNSITDTLTVNVTNSAPTANAGTDQTVSVNTPVTLDGSGSSDPDGHTPLSYGWTQTGGPSVTLSDRTSISPTFTTPGSPTVLTFSLTVTDAYSLLDTTPDEVVITVNEVNLAPVLAAIGNQIITETFTLTFTAIATDANGDTLTYGLYNAPTGATINSNTGVFTWTPTESDTMGLVTILVTDTGGLTDSTTILVTVIEVNSPPTLATIDDKSIQETSTLSFTLSATDTDLPANSLTYSMSNAPDGASLDANSGFFTWTPTYTQGPGAYQVTFIVTDNGSPVLSDSQTIIITVTDSGIVPNLTITKTVQATTNPPAPGDPLTYTIIIANSGNGNAANVIVTDTLPSGLSGSDLSWSGMVMAYKSLTFTINANIINNAAYYNTTITNSAYFSHTSAQGQADVALTTLADITPPTFITLPVLITPTNGISVTTGRPTFDWEDAIDDLSGVVSYTLHISSSNNVLSLAEAVSVQESATTIATTQSNFTPSVDMANGVYIWTVRAYDAVGNVSSYVSPAATFVISKPSGGNIIYLPLIFNASVSSESPNSNSNLSDLVVDNLIATSSQVTVTIRNAGSTVLNNFWVDIYFNPNQTPTLNQAWDTIAPAGAVWGVTKPLAQNEILILTTGGNYYHPNESSNIFPVGATVYAYVDSINQQHHLRQRAREQ